MGKFYITTAIDYANAKPHIGHALEKVQADALARYHRQKGDDVFFLTGTDEHGMKIARVAEIEGKDPQIFVDEVSKNFKDLKKVLNLSFDDFIRTTDKKRHWPGVQKLWQKLADAGDIYKKKYRGLYCVGHESFIGERELINGKCHDHQKEPEAIEEENYFFKLSRYSEEIGGRIRSKQLRIIPESRENEILSLIENEGLEDVSFSRTRKILSWGIPVPGDDAQTIYVWCDALTNYISAIGYGRDEEYRKWWPANVQVIGKDILRFHAAIWPGMLLAAELPLPRAILVHGFITVEGQKMSKTVGNVLDPVALVKKYGTDPVRYYLLREISMGEDGDFSEGRFIEVYNSELANGLGNLTSRVIKMARNAGIKYEHPRYSREEWVGKDPVFREYDEYLEKMNIRKASDSIWTAISSANQYIEEHKPFQTIKINPKKAEGDIQYLLGQLHRIAVMVEPFIPDTASVITKLLKEDSEPGTAIFPRIP